MGLYGCYYTYFLKSFLVLYCCSVVYELYVITDTNSIHEDDILVACTTTQYGVTSLYQGQISADDLPPSYQSVVTNTTKYTV